MEAFLKALRTITLLVVLAGLLAAFYARPAAAQADQISLSVTPAGDGYFKNGEWLAVWAEIENGGQDVDAQLAVQITGSSSQTTYAAAVSLPSGARKRVPLYILPNNFSRELEIQLTAQDKLLAKARFTVHPQVNINYLVGLVAGERGGLALLNGITLPGQSRPKVILDLALADIPERSEALASFDLLVFNDVDTSRLTPAQAEALAGWVRQGRQLVIGGGTGTAVTLSGLPTALLPVALDGQSEVQADDLSELVAFAGGSAIRTTGTFVCATVTRAAQARTLAAASLSPLVVEGTYGEGRVDFIGLNLSSAPFNSWPDTIAFWNRLLAPLGQYPDGQPADISMRQMAGMNIVGNLSNIPALDLPSIRWLAILLAVYILLVGPVNYLVLRRLRRLQLAWLTIPTLTLLFSAGAFGIGYLMRGTDVIMNQIALIAPNGSGSATVTSYLGLFSPTQRSYSLEVKTPGLLSAITGYDGNPWNSSGVVSGGSVTFVQGDRPMIQGLSIDQWSFQTFAEEEQWQQFGSLSGDLHLENEKIVGTIRNDTTLRLTDNFLIVGPYFIHLGDLAVGQEKPVELDLGNLPADRFGPPVTYRLYENESMNPASNSRLLNLKISILSSSINGKGMQFASFRSVPVVDQSSSLTSSLSDLSVTFLGWVDQAPPDVTLDGLKIQKQAIGLVTQKLAYKLVGSDELTIPIGMIPGAMTLSPVNGGACGNGEVTGVYMQQGAAELTFQLPDLGEYSAQELRLNLSIDGPPQDAPKIELYQWADEAWTEIKDSVIGVNAIAQPQKYINADRSVRVRITMDPNSGGFCSYIDLGLKAVKTTTNGGQDVSH
jgi:hypothetical protein